MPLRAAAVLVLLIDSPEGPLLLLTERAPTLRTKPGILVFPGGAAEVSDDGPIATALREAREEVGVDPATVHIVGMFPSLPVPADGFLVTAIVGWCERLKRLSGTNPAEVAAIVTVPIHELARRSRPAEFFEDVGASAPPLSIDGTPVGAMTTALIDWLFGGP
jgi:8-oxo-dGTP pyrophosphatase MutT (NUDIX family)